MATFNSMPSAIPSGASPNDALGLNAAAALGPNSLGIQAFDQELNFDDGMLDSVNGGLHGLPFTSTYDFDHFTTTFEDPFHYPKPYDVAPEPGAYPDDEGSSPQQLDDKLLGFSAVAVKAQPVDDATGNLADVGMSAELYGMFFVAEDVFGGEPTGAARPLELTCYRRNLWQCSGQITMPRHCAQAVNEQGRAVPLVEFYAAISAAESIEGKPTEIISIPWKSSAGHHPPGLGEGQETKTAGPPPRIPLDFLGAGQDVADGRGHRVALPVSWKRLQFKSATANNGRRKGLQQHYVVRITLLGKMKVGGELMKIAEIQSGPVIVRGRSPRNFDGRKDVPLSGEKKTSGSGSSSGGGGGERQRSHTQDIPTATPKQERAEVPQSLLQFQPSVGNSSLHAPSGSGDWATTPTYGGASSQPSQPPPAKKMSMSPNPGRPPVPSWSREPSSSAGGSGPSTTTKPKPAALRSHQASPAGPSLPISLSLSEDERSPNHGAHPRASMSDVLQSPNLHRAGTAASLHHGQSSPYEEAEQLYEYFPLSIDDWTPLVDTVYRPHIVHHIAVPQEIKAQKVRSKAKRYFSAE